MRKKNQICGSVTAAFLVLVVVCSFPYRARAADGKRDRHSQALEWRRLRLQNENGEIPADAWMKAAEQKKRMPIDPGVGFTIAPKGGHAGPMQREVAGIQPSSWTWLGPGSIGGRVRSILINPTNASIMWAGGVGGGVWKTLNGGASWFPLDDFMANLAISCMVMDPTNPNIIYSGTGEGFGNTDAIRGAGIFRTTDGGTTWAQLPSTSASSFLFVNRLAISPADPMTILAATWTGILRSANGGISWSTRASAAAMDLAFDPTDGTKCVASGVGFASFSTNGGLTWTTSASAPHTFTNRVEIAYAPSNPNIVYASVADNEGELFQSADGGRSFSLVNTGTRYMGDQGWYDNCVWVDPTDSNIVVVGGEDILISLNGGVKLADIGGLHPDQHVIVNHPGYNGSNQRAVFVGNDGGIFKTADIRPGFGGFPWTALNNNLGITEFYGIAGSAPGHGSRGYVVGGTQDNGVLQLNLGDAPNSWAQKWGGDGGFCAADPTDPNVYYGEYVNLQIERSTGPFGYISGGIADSGDAQKANFIAPFILDPNNPDTMLAGGWRLWRSANVKTLSPGWSIIKPGIAGGSASSNNISAIAVAQGNSDIIWVGHNRGEVFATMNGTAASPSWTRMDTNGLPHRFCTRITIDPLNPNLVYVTFGSFSNNNVWRTTDGGGTWASISGNLPTAPVNTLVVDPRITSRVYVGTEVGIFASVDGGAHWSPSNDGPANVAVDELAWMGPNLLAATHGRGCFMITPAVWVEFNPACPFLCGDGTFGNPFNKVSLALDIVSPAGSIFFKPGTSGNCLPGQDCFPMIISTSVAFEAFGGPATIGQ